MQEDPVQDVVPHALSDDDDSNDSFIDDDSEQEASEDSAQAGPSHRASEPAKHSSRKRLRQSTAAQQAPHTSTADAAGLEDDDVDAGGCTAKKRAGLQARQKVAAAQDRQRGLGR